MRTAPLIALVLAACDASRAAPTVTIADSAGVLIVSADLRDSASAPRCSVDSAPRFRFGAESAPTALVFGEIPSIAVRAQGDLAVLDRPARQVRIFDQRGTLRFTLGRAGEGPGEFGDPISVIALAEDSLAVWDWGLGRLVIFDPEGRHVRSVAVHPPIGNPLAHLAISSAPRRYWLTGVQLDVLPRGTEYVTQHFALYRFDSTLTQRDTVARLRWRTYGWVDERSRQTGSPVFDARGTVVGNDSLLFVADGISPVIEVRGTDWTLRRSLRWTEPDRRITPEVAAEYRRAFVARIERPVDRRNWEKTLAAVPVGDSIPTIVDLIAGTDGTLAARRFQRHPGRDNEFLVFGPTGAFACVLTTPAAFRVRAMTSDLLVGTEVGVGGVPRVVGRSIRYPGR